MNRTRVCHSRDRRLYHQANFSRQTSLSPGQLLETDVFITRPTSRDRRLYHQANFSRQTSLSPGQLLETDVFLTRPTSRDRRLYHQANFSRQTSFSPGQLLETDVFITRPTRPFGRGACFAQVSRREREMLAERSSLHSFARVNETHVSPHSLRACASLAQNGSLFSSS